MKTIIVYIKSMAAAGGIERVISNLIGVWEKKYHVILLVKDDEEKSFYDLPKGIEWISIHEPLVLNMKNRLQRVISVFGNSIRSHRKLKRVLKELSFDYIYTTTSLNGLEVYLANPRYRRKMVVSEHASAYAVNGVYQRIKKFLYPKVYCVSVPNKMDCELYEKWKCNTEYVPHLVSFREPQRNRLDTKIALNIGRYTNDKRQIDLIEIWSKIENKNGWVLWIVGSGELQHELENAIKMHNLEETVRLIPPTTNIKDVYKQASLFLFTSRMEGFGMVLLEAMAFGIPCVSYDCPSGPRDVVKDHFNGRLIDNGNKSQFVSAVQEIISGDEVELQQYGENAFSTVNKWDNDGIKTKWEKIFSE
ncbi:MAG: glycosyltransferase family 4 protein [Lachnospiraceae bacterium]|nr:glycosyltransferase family 4 protein [Lachnospiraceae bacterium]